MRYFALLFLLISTLPACSHGSLLQPHSSRIQVIGDSTFAWNGGQMVRSMMFNLGIEVDDHSMSGAKITEERLFARLLGPDITAAANPLPRDWLVMTGGANDLGGECGCTACAGVLNDLISPSGETGEIMDIILPALDLNTRVIYAVYYDAPRGGGPFSACVPAFNELAARINRAADRHEGLYVIDMGDALDPDNPQDYDRDRIHPSPVASVRIAKLITDVIMGVEGL
ncbi:MAG: SGNH/GDSL hydrolase family protein [Pseudomonadota bacterium]